MKSTTPDTESLPLDLVHPFRPPCIVKGGGKGVIVKIRCCALLSILLLSGGFTVAQSPLQPAPTTQNRPPIAAQGGKVPTPDQIIRAFSATETEFCEAWMEYTYHQDADVRVLSVNGIPKRRESVPESSILKRRFEL